MARRNRGARASQVSPLAVFVPLRLVSDLAGSAALRRTEKRAIVFMVAATHRGRGRIPNALRDEAAFLNRVQRRLALLRRGPLDARQTAFPFMLSLPEHLANDWEDAIRRARISTDREWAS